MVIAFIVFLLVIGPLAVRYGADSRNTRSYLTLR
jgi:hypothetical protein